MCHSLKPAAEHRVEFSPSRAGAAEPSEAQSTGRNPAIGRAELQPGEQAQNREQMCESLG